MARKSHCCSITLISIGAFIVLMAGFMTIGGFGLFLRIGLKMGLKLLPVNEDLQVWINIPLPMTVQAKITGVDSISAFDNKVGGGDLTLDLKLSKWEEAEDGEEEIKLSEFIHIQETAEIDQIQYYKALLSTSVYNWASFFSWMLISFATFFIGGGVALKLRNSGSRSEKQ